MTLRRLTDDEVVDLVAPRIAEAAIENKATGNDIMVALTLLGNMLAFLEESGVILATELRETREVVEA